MVKDGSQDASHMSLIDKATGPLTQFSLYYKKFDKNHTENS